MSDYDCGERVAQRSALVVRVQYNFVGRLLGPRGMTAKQLEKELDCKLMVRGRGSMRDKAKVLVCHLVLLLLLLLLYYYYYYTHTTADRLTCYSIESTVPTATRFVRFCAHATTHFRHLNTCNSRLPVSRASALPLTVFFFTTSDQLPTQRRTATLFCFVSYCRAHSYS